MPTDLTRPPPRHRHWTTRDTVRGVLLTCIAGGALAGASMNLMRELASFPANGFFELHQEQFSAATDEGRRLAKATQLYQKVSPSLFGPEEQRRLAVLMLLQRQRSDKSNPNQLDPTPFALLTSSIRQAPAQPLAWAYLADASIADPRKSLDSARFLEQSYRVGPLEPDLALYRLTLALDTKNYWNHLLLADIQRDIANLFAYQHGNPICRELIQEAKNQPALASFALTLLTTNTKALARFRQDL